MHRVAVFGWLVRALLLALAMQVGGVLHAAADALVTAGVVEGEHEQCPVDGACDDCLPGCPNCHCAAGLRTVAPAAFALEPLHGEPGLALRSTDGSPAPLGPTLPSVYRPPRDLVRAAFIS